MSRRQFWRPTIRTARETVSECAPHNKVVATGWSASRVHWPGPRKGISAAGVASVRRPPTLATPTFTATLFAVESRDEGEAKVVAVFVVVAFVRVVDVAVATGVTRDVARGVVVGVVVGVGVVVVVVVVVRVVDGFVAELVEGGVRTPLGVVVW
ncbi:MAG: hypothetical protein KGJ47_07115 [Acidobacteriota bacterium]|nr:hypothetical protein [Acidobacteriota bacterium]